MLVARWLIVLTISLNVLPGKVFAEKPVAAGKACSASCAARCPCCISKAPAPNPPAPLAPTSSPRTVIAKDFQLPSLLNALLLKENEAAAFVPSDCPAGHFSVSIPVFVRHCSFLI